MSRLMTQAVIAMIATAFVAAATRIGPTILIVSQTHGVHSGDLIPAAMFMVVASKQTAVRAALRQR